MIFYKKKSDIKKQIDCMNKANAKTIVDIKLNSKPDEKPVEIHNETLEDEKPD